MTARSFWIGLGIGCSIVLLFQWSLLVNIAAPVGLAHGDSHLVYFILQHWMESLRTGAWDTLSTLPMFHGFSGSLFFTDTHVLQAILAAPWYWMTGNIVSAAHVVVLLSLAWSFASMYILLWHQTRHMWAGLIGGILYVLNPFVLSRYPDQLNLLSLQFLPLIVLFFERMFLSRSGINGFLFFFFLLCQAASSLNYMVLLTLILPVYIIVRCVQKQQVPAGARSLGALAGLVLFFSTVMFMGVQYRHAYKDYPLRRGIDAARYYAARPTDWLFTAPSNGMYGRLKAWSEHQAPGLVRMGIYSEHNLFPGFIFLALLLAGSIDLYRHRAGKAQDLLWVVLAGISWLLSLGPDVMWSDSWITPGLYRVAYAIDPFLQYIRVPARFGVFVFFFGALLAGAFIARKSKSMAGRSVVVLGCLLVIGLLVEYRTVPLDFVSIPQSQQQLYEAINARTDIGVILEYPIGNLIDISYPQARPEDYDARYLLWATLLHDKALFNGYSGFLPPEYYRRADMLSINFPTEEKIRQLQAWGVHAIVVHRSEFRQPLMYDDMVSMMRRRGVPLLVENEAGSVFDLTGY